MVVTIADSSFCLPNLFVFLGNSATTFLRRQDPPQCPEDASFERSPHAFKDLGMAVSPEGSPTSHGSDDGTAQFRTRYQVRHPPTLPRIAFPLRFSKKRRSRAALPLPPPPHSANSDRASNVLDPLGITGAARNFPDQHWSYFSAVWLPRLRLRPARLFRNQFVTAHPLAHPATAKRVTSLLPTSGGRL